MERLPEAFCPRCVCRYEQRNTLIIKVVVREGRQKPRFDFFGSWTPIAEMPVHKLRGCTLPDPTICSHDILDANFEWTGNYEIPFDTFDILAKLGIDMTGLKTSATHRGSLYRAHALSTLG